MDPEEAEVEAATEALEKMDPIGEDWEGNGLLLGETGVGEPHRLTGQHPVPDTPFSLKVKQDLLDEFMNGGANSSVWGMFRKKVHTSV